MANIIETAMALKLGQALNAHTLKRYSRSSSMSYKIHHTLPGEIASLAVVKSNRIRSLELDA